LVNNLFGAIIFSGVFLAAESILVRFKEKIFRPEKITTNPGVFTTRREN
jgi:hypothetical protein